MQAFRKSALIVALAFGAAGAMAGEIAGSTINGSNSSNLAGGLNAKALQNIGVAEGPRLGEGHATRATR